MDKINLMIDQLLNRRLLIATKEGALEAKIIELSPNKDYCCAEYRVRSEVYGWVYHQSWWDSKGVLIMLIDFLN